MRHTSQQSIQSFAFIIGIGGAVCLSCGFALSAGPDAQFHPLGEAQLDSRINPNDAPVESLVRLPGLGLGRAGAIVAYRQSAALKGRNPAFRSRDDLQRVRGIGPKTVQGIGEWITFDQDGGSHDG